jgi:hypothetical protein
VILVWVATPVSLGVFVYRVIDRRQWHNFAWILLTLLVLGATLLEAFTGYLEPENPLLELEATNRFIVLHQIFIPVVLTALFALWFYALGPPSQVAGSPPVHRTGLEAYKTQEPG